MVPIPSPLIGRSMVVVLLILGVACTGTPREGRETGRRVYHVQVGMTKEKAEAHETMGHAVSWWKTHASTVDPRPISSSRDSPVNIVWKAPLYRVRLGPFSTAEEAKRVLSALDSTFPSAFVAPGRPPAETGGQPR